MIVFAIIKSVNDSRYEEAMRIYSDAFPANERQLPATIKERMETGKSTMIVGSVNEEVAAFVLLYHLHNSNFLLLDYLAVKNAYRSAGVGSAFMRHIKDYLRQQNKMLLLEVEDPGFGNNKEQRKSRINFYIRNSACILHNVPFILPALQGLATTNMLLMIITNSNEKSMQGKYVQQLITDIYFEVYGRNSNDELLLSFINQVTQIVTLSCDYV